MASGSSRTGKRSVDVAMCLLLLLDLAYQLTGNTAHECLGFVTLGLFGLHNYLNRTWYARLFAGTYRWRRRLSLLITIFLGLAMALVMLSGLLGSHLLPSLHCPVDGLCIRKLHTIASYWGVVFMALHVGMHAELLQAEALGSPAHRPRTRLTTIASLALSGVILSLGAVAAHERSLWGKLFLGETFDTWDPQRPSILFFGANLAIVLALAHMMSLLLHRGPRVRKNQSPTASPFTHSELNPEQPKRPMKGS